MFGCVQDPVGVHVLNHTGVAYLAIGAVVLIVLAFVPHLEFASIRRKLFRFLYVSYYVFCPGLH